MLRGLTVSDRTFDWHFLECGQSYDRIKRIDLQLTIHHCKMSKQWIEMIIIDIKFMYFSNTIYIYLHMNLVYA